MTGNILIDYTKWLFKYLFFAMLGLAALSAIFFSIVSGSDWYSKGRHAAKIEVSAWNCLDPKSGVERLFKDGQKCLCDAEASTLILVNNNSTRTMKKYSIAITGHLPEHSNDITADLYTMDLDDVLAPNGGKGQCYFFRLKDGFTDRAAQVIYEAQLSSVEFSD